MRANFTSNFDNSIGVDKHEKNQPSTTMYILNHPPSSRRLTVVHDGLGNKLSLQRDYTNRVQSIENALGQKHAVALSRFGNLLALEPVGGVPVRLEYLDDISGKG